MGQISQEVKEQQARFVCLAHNLMVFPRRKNRNRRRQRNRTPLEKRWEGRRRSGTPARCYHRPQYRNPTYSGTQIAAKFNPLAQALPRRASPRSPKQYAR